MPDAIGAKAAYGAAQNARLGGTGSVITSRPAPISSGGGGGGGSSPAPPPARPWYENYDLATLARMVKADPSRVLPQTIIDQFPNEVFLDNRALVSQASSGRQQTLFRDRPELNPVQPPRIVMPPPPVPPVAAAPAPPVAAVPPAVAAPSPAIDVVTSWHNRRTGEVTKTMRGGSPPDGSGDWETFGAWQNRDPAEYAKAAAGPGGGTPAPPPAAAVPAPPPVQQGPYDAFNKAFRGAIGRDITQDELNDNDFLQKLGNDLFRLLPVDRQVGFSSARIAELSNQDAWPVLKKLAEINPQGFVTAFPTSFWRRFDNDKIAKDFLPLFSQHNPTEAANIIRQNGIGGANAGALPPEQRPGLPGGLPGAPSTGVPAPPSLGAPSTPRTPPPAYTGPGEFAIPRAAPPVLSADILSRSALDQFYQNLGYGDFGGSPPVMGAPPAASPVGARLSGAAPPNVAPRPFPGRPPYDEPPEGVEVEVGEDGQTYWRDPDTGRAFNPATQMIENEDGTWSLIDDEPGGRTTPPNTGTTPPEGWEENPNWDPRPNYQSPSNPRWIRKPAAPRPPVGRAPARPAQPSQAALIGPDLLRDEVQSQIDLRDAQIADLMAKRDQAKAEMEAATANRQEANQIAWANLAREIESNIQATQLARDTLIQRQAEFGVEASGMIGSQPTFQREQVINQAELNNKKFQLEAATNAAQIALKQADQAETTEARRTAQAEATRQFDIAQGLKAEIERGQLGLSTEIQRGQLGLATRSQEEAERQGGFGRELEAARFRREVEQSPASFAQRAYALRGQQAPPPVSGTAAPPAVSFAPAQAPPPVRSGPAPGTTPSYPQWQPIGSPNAPELDETEYIGRPAVTAPPAAARLHNVPPPARNQYATPAQQSFATTLNPLTAAEIKANVGPGLANTLEGRAPGQFFSEVPRLSAQRFGQLLPSERKEYAAASLASGTDPDDLMEEIRRRSQTGTPPPAVTTRTRRAPRASLY